MNLLRSLLLIIIFLTTGLAGSENMVIVIIDGARFSETFGDRDHTYIPNMAAMAEEGTMINSFYNDSLTYTSRAIPALWCGTWTPTRDTVYEGIATQYAVKPSLFEYFRKQKSLPESSCIYVLKSITNLWLPSFDTGYGPDFWPYFHSQGSTDMDVANEAQYVMERYYPNVMFIYLADVDGAGHSGSWNSYTSAIVRADSIVGVLWKKIKSDPIYRDKTTMIITNDHGRHDDQNGGFRGHGDSCEGCRHIMFLAVGPKVKINHVSHISRRIPDMAVTAANLLGVRSEKATGEIMTEIFYPTSSAEELVENERFELEQNFPNPFNSRTTISYTLPQNSEVELAIFNATGQKIHTLCDARQPPGKYRVTWAAGSFPSGVYLCRLKANGYTRTRKLLLLK